jgi:hypothetical protein
LRCCFNLLPTPQISSMGMIDISFLCLSFF